MKDKNSRLLKAGDIIKEPTNGLLHQISEDEIKRDICCMHYGSEEQHNLITGCFPSKFSEYIEVFQK
jgi:hypothetical protein